MSNEWTPDLDIFTREMGIESHQRSLMHGARAGICHNKNWWNKILVIVFLGVINILQLITIISDGEKYVLWWSITTITIATLVGVMVQFGHMMQYSMKESLHTKISADYELLYQNVRQTLTCKYKDRQAGRAYSTYIYKAFTRIKTSEQFIPPKLDEKYSKVDVNIPIYGEHTTIEIYSEDAKSNDSTSNDSTPSSSHNQQFILRKRPSKIVMDKIKNKMDSNEISALDSYQMHRFVHNL